MDLDSLLQLIPSSDHWVLLVAYLFGIVVAHFLIGPTISIMWELLKLEAKDRKLPSPAAPDTQPDPFIRYTWQVASVGFVERALYMASLQIQRPEFIAVWLTLKTIAKAKRWTEDGVNPGRVVYNNFLVGNGLSILYPLVAVGGIQWAIGPSCDLDYVLAVGAPLAIALINIVFILWLRQQRSKLKSRLKNASEPKNDDGAKLKE